MTGSASPRLDARLGSLIAPYAAIISDVWGVVHNGVEAWAPAVDALVQARASGRPVVLLTNAPRPNHCIYPQLDGLGVPRNAYDAIITSGDMARDWVAARPGIKVWHIGPDRDLPVFDGLDATLVGMDEAEAIVCTGPYDDEVDTPDMYRARLAAVQPRGLPFICANPDFVVEKGTRLIYCAGALGDLYRELGGTSLFMGKPDRSIYQRAVLALSALAKKDLGARDILAIGDAIRTDIKGAANMDMDALFIAGGIHSAQAGSPEALDVEALTQMFRAAGVSPAALSWSLKW